MPFEFTLTYELPHTQSDANLLMTRLGGDGCTDALVELGAVCRVRLAFAREAPTAEAAARVAMDAVKRELPDARLLQIQQDGDILMALTEPQFQAIAKAVPLFHDMPVVSDDFLSERASQHQPERESL